MSNEVAVFGEQTDISDIPQKNNFIPYLSVAYGTTAAVSEGLAAPGEFVFDGKQSLGKKIEIIVIDFRLHLSVWNDNTSSTDSDCYVLSTDPKRCGNEEYVKFLDQELAPSCKMNEGVDLLVWLPAVNSFAVIYLKGTTYDSFAPIYTAGKGYRLVQISTEQKVNKKNGRKFFIIHSLALERAVVSSPLKDVPGVNVSCDISIPVDFAAAALKKFRTIRNTEIATESNVVDR